MWIEISLLLFLGVCAVCDGMKKEIPVVVVWLGICTAVVFYCLYSGVKTLAFRRNL